MSELEYGELYPLPLESSIMEQFDARMHAKKRVIGLAHFVLESTDISVSVPLKNYELLWLCGYVSAHQGEVVTSKEVVFSGYPHIVGVNDVLAPVQKRMQTLIRAGLPIAHTGGRRERKYHLPHYSSAHVEYVEDPQSSRFRDERFSYVNEIRQRAGDILDSAKNHVKTSAEYKLPTLAHGLDEIFPLHKRLRANCRGIDPNLFISHIREDVANAKRICRTCSVRDSCLAYAKATGLQGVWGGEYFPFALEEEES